MVVSTGCKQERVEFEIGELSRFIMRQGVGIIEYSYLVDKVLSGDGICFQGRDGHMFMLPVAVDEQSIVVNVIVS